MGVFTTIVNIASFYILVEIMNVDYKAATVAAWILSVLFAYITNKLYVFQQKTHDLQSLLKELTAFFQRSGPVSRHRFRHDDHSCRPVQYK